MAQLYEDFIAFERDVQSVQKQRNDNAASMKARFLAMLSQPVKHLAITHSSKSDRMM